MTKCGAPIGALIFLYILTFAAWDRGFEPLLLVYLTFGSIFTTLLTIAHCKGWLDK